MLGPNNNAIYLLTGLPGSGKTTAGRCIDNLSVAEIDPHFSPRFRETHTIRMRWLLQEYGTASSSGNEPIIAELRNFHQEQRDKGNSEAIFEPLRAIRDSIVVIDAIRDIDDLYYLQRAFGATAMGLILPEPIAHEQFMHDQDDDKHRLSIKQFEKHIPKGDDVDRMHAAREMAWEHAISEFGPDPENHRCIQEADVKINASQSFPAVAKDSIDQIRLSIRASISN